MKKLIIAAAAVAFAAPAFAATYTVQFDGDDGESITWTFDNSTMTATAGDVSVPYTWDEAALTVCGEMPEEGEVCATFAEAMAEPGATTTFTGSDGGTGTATLVSLEE